MARMIRLLTAPAVVTRSIASPVAAVWDVIADPTTYPAWLVGAKRIRSVDPDWPRPGTEFEHEVGGGPVTVHDTTEVTVDEPGRELRLIARARPLFEADVRFRLAPDATGTLVHLTERPRGPFVFATPLARPVVRSRNARSLKRLAEYLERTGAGRATAASSP